MIKFGTGGWRAIIADGFTKENIRLLTAGLCALMEKEGHAGAEICVGYDRRFLSKESAHWACEVLAGYGFRPYVINRSSPTPLIMFTVKRRNMPYGMAVTASHNPAIYNGIKVFTEGGRDADAEVTRRIEAEIEKLSPADVKSVDYDTALAEGKIVEDYPMNEYLDSILSAVNVEAIKKASLRIGFDPMYGVSWSSSTTATIRSSAASCPRRTSIRSSPSPRLCSTGTAISALRPTATPTVSASSITKGSSSTRTSCSCCSTTIL